MDLCRRQVCGSEAAQRGLVAARAAAQRIDGKRGSAVGYVVRNDEGGELLVRRENFVVNRGRDLVRKTLLIRIGKAGREIS